MFAASLPTDINQASVTNEKKKKTYIELGHKIHGMLLWQLRHALSTYLSDVLAGDFLDPFDPLSLFCPLSFWVCDLDKD